MFVTEHTTVVKVLEIGHQDTLGQMGIAHEDGWSEEQIHTKQPFRAARVQLVYGHTERFTFFGKRTQIAVRYFWAQMREPLPGPVRVDIAKAKVEHHRKQS